MAREGRKGRGPDGEPDIYRYIYIFIYICTYTYIYIYIYICRERERDIAGNYLFMSIITIIISISISIRCLRSADSCRITLRLHTKHAVGNRCRRLKPKKLKSSTYLDNMFSACRCNACLYCLDHAALYAIVLCDTRTPRETVSAPANRSDSFPTRVA